MAGPKDLMDFVVGKQAAELAKVNEAKARQLAVMALLEELGGQSVKDDSLTFEGDKIILPAQYEGNVLQAAAFLKSYHEAQEKHYNHQQKFLFRPWDGANAFNNAMYKVFGSTGIGQSTFSLFGGEQPPQLITINTGVNETIQVPWGQVAFPPLEAVFSLGGTNDREYGTVFVLAVEAPKKYQKHIAAFFKMVEKELREGSIYKGKAINGAAEARFLDLTKIDPNKVIYSTEVMEQLSTHMWSLLRHTDKMRELQLPLKRAILLEGPYGTGKTLAGTLTAKEAVENGWTFILCRPGEDNLYEVLKTAQIYAPAVVWYEDIDTLASGGSSEEISKLLDALDGAQGKGHEVLAGFTTNFVQNIQRGVLRPGRLDAIIHIGQLDGAAMRKLINNLIPTELLGDIDYNAVSTAMKEFMPAFVTEAIGTALRYTVSRTKGNPEKIVTEDLVKSAQNLQYQLDLMNGAGEGSTKPSLDSVFKSNLVEVLNKTETQFYDGEAYGMRFNDEREVESKKASDAE